MAATGDLVRQRSAPVGDDGTSDRLEQDAVFVRDLLRRTDEDAARSIDHMRFDARGNQPHDLFMKHLTVTGTIFVPDHQVDGQPLGAPVRVGLYKLADQIDIGRVSDLQQHNR